MKNILCLVTVFVFLVLSVHAQQTGECTINRNSDGAFVIAAINSLETTVPGIITNISWHRVSATEGKVDITVDGQRKEISVKQSCATGVLEATLITQDTSHFRCVEWVNCMPTIGEEVGTGAILSDSECSDRYFEWAKANCAVQPKTAN